MSSLSDLKLVYRVSSRTVGLTLEFLQKMGTTRCEGVALWPGRVVGGICEIGSPLIPKQITGPLFYRIPDEETIRIVKYVSERGMVIPIQVHSHPQEAFHSFADDERAFVQHENAMSIVVPNFANFPISRFLDRALFFRLLAGNRWRELAPKEVGIILRIEAR